MTARRQIAICVTLITAVAFAATDRATAADNKPLGGDRDRKLVALPAPGVTRADHLAQGFRTPPDEAKPRVYWWWLNNLVSKEGITRDLEELKAKGIGGVLLFNAGMAAGPMPSGPDFMSPQWRELLKHAVREADRLRLEVSLNLCSGWDAGGPWITDEIANHHYVQAELTLKGPQKFVGKLPHPPGDVKAYHDVAVQAFPRPPADSEKKVDRHLLAIKAGRDSVFDRGLVRAGVEPPLGPSPFDPAAAGIAPAAIMDLTGRLKPDGTLTWDVPAGEWTILRTGYTITGQMVSCSTKGGEGFEMEFLDTRAMDLHVKSMADVLLNDSAPLVGKCIKYLHDDSWEAGHPNWTRDFLAEFKKYRGYDARPYLPALAGHTVGSPEISDRFLYDLRKTIADCLAENHYARFAELAHARGVGVHCEGGGPCWPKVVPMDALRNLGRCDIPMGEFWQDDHWREHSQNNVGKQTASAAHIYGKRWVMAEAFTSMGPHWEEDPAQLKPTADIALCEGINRFVCHTSTCTRAEDGKPGYEYFAGTHFNRNITWWEQAGAWTAYIARCQWLLSRGQFVADVCYYNGDWAPNLVGPKHVDPVLGPGYDYDACNAEVLLTRMSVKDGRVVLPDGMSYRLLVLPDRKFMPVEVLRRVKDLVEAGATVAGPRPERDPGLKNYPRCDAEVKELAAGLWGQCDGKAVKQCKSGRGRIVWGNPLREVLAEGGVAPDFQYTGNDKDAFLDFIHRRDGETEIYFVANRRDRNEAARCTFRVSGRQPELWDPVSGSMREAAAFSEADGRTTLPLDFGPYGSIFVIFRRPIPVDHQGTAARNSPQLSEPVKLAGPWTVRFDPKWGGPAEPVQLKTLADWTSRPEAGIKYYSGTASYEYETFDLPPSIPLDSQSAIYLDLGEVKNVAEVKLNGKELGVLWTRPFRIEVSGTVKPKDNRLEVRITNLWPNRLIGDAALPAEKRFTRTHVTKFTKDTPLRPSGLLGPVTLQSAKGVDATTHSADTPSPIPVAPNGAETPPRQTSRSGDSYLVLVDNRTYADATLRGKLDLYFQNVQRLFGLSAAVVEVPPFAPAAPGENITSIRGIIKRRWQEQHICGVLLLGQIPYMIWRQAAGGNWVNFGPEDFYYAHLDADFQDRETRYGNGNSDILRASNTAGNALDNQLVPGREHSPDGQYDTYTRGTREGPALWVSRIYAPTARQYYDFFDKANAYYRNIIEKLNGSGAATIVPYKDLLYTGHPDYLPSASSDKYRFFEKFTKSLAGSQFVVFGENRGGTVAELFSNYDARTYLFAEVDGHADPHHHHLKGGAYSVADVHRRLAPARGALIQALWGCHSGDFTCIKNGQVNLTFAYILSPGTTQAAYGCSWTSGTEEAEQEILNHMAQGDYLGVAFQKMQKRLYSRAYMEKFFANEAARRVPNHFLPAKGTEKERMDVLMTKLLRGYNLVGNPFVKISYSK